MRREGWLVFAAWVLAGALAAFSLLGAASIGLFIAPLTAVAVWLAARFGRVWPEILGTISGAGTASLLIAFLNWGETPCTERLLVGSGQTEVSCGGLAPTPWLVAGLVLVAMGVVGYALARRRIDSGGRGPLLPETPGASTAPDRG